MSLGESTATGLGYVRLYPGDLALVSLAAAVVYYLVTVLEPGSAIRLLAAFPLVAFLPGYALVSVLFPTRERRRESEGPTAGIDGIERLALAVALSLVIVPVVALGLAVTVWGLAPGPAAAVLAGLTIALAQLGVARRLLVPEGDRFSAAAAMPSVAADDPVVTASTAVLVVSILAVGVAFAGAFGPASSAATFTELGMYTEDDDGELVAGALPDETFPAESIPVVYAIDNQEGTEVEYTLVVQEQRVEGDTVVDRTELESVPVTVADGEREAVPLDVTPAAENDTVRIAGLLYADEPPSTPTMDDADERVHFWVNVTGGDGDDLLEIEGEDEDDETDVLDLLEDDDDTDVDGEDGADGEDADGAGAVDGVGADGEDGADGVGADGEDGADGVGTDVEDDADEDGGIVDDIIDSIFGDDDEE